ncbi:hypothetical protein L7F22_020577 [Adiantum nelumboides]|nr:hypothetical protein [Adiantum nelumboides]
MAQIKSLCSHALLLILALVKALQFADDEGVAHNDLHPWNIIVDFTKDLTPCIGIIDWGLALRVGLELQKTNNTDKNWQKLHPWQADELLDGKDPCPWSKATDVYAIGWVIWSFCKFYSEFSNYYGTEWYKRKVPVEVQAISRLILDD